MKVENIRGKIPAVAIIVCSLLIGVFSFTLDAVANDDPIYELTVTVISEHGTVEPNSGFYPEGTVVSLTATPEPTYAVRQWTGTDDDTSCALTNTVTMNSDKAVTVEFGQPRSFLVPAEYTTIQGAIDAADCGDVVILNTGVYVEDINFNGKNIRVTSTNPDDPMCVAYTIIQGTGAGPVVTFSGTEAQNCVLDGLTITDGNTTGDGGGICCNGTEATISNCVITDNHADGYGGGVSNCSGMIMRCTITGNTANGGGGGIYVEDCNVTVEDCDIHYNAAADGGGVYFLDSQQATITRCIISDNDANGSGTAKGGGIFAFNSPILIGDCRISRNIAMSGGGVWLAGETDGGVLQVRQCLITENTAGFTGGGISCVWQVEPIISNCTIADNTVADGYGGGLYCSYESNVEVINSIIWGNFAQQGFQVAVCSGEPLYPLPSRLALSHSDVEGGQGGVYVGMGSTLDWGIGNIDSDPQLVDPAGGDLHLGIDSPCIDAGDNSALPSVLTDLDGNPRIVNGTVDMGAYESPYQPLTVYHVDCVNGDNTNDGLARETAFKTIQRGINVAEDHDKVLVWPGVYNEEVAFWGEAITVKSAADAAVVETDYGYAFSFFSAEEPNTVLSNFVIRNSQYGIYLINGAGPTLTNLTIVNNDFGISAFNGADPDISNCIFWNNYYGDLFRDFVPLQVRYSCIEEGSEGEGNISTEPGFVDANNGDYHLLSERGRYWPAHDVWVLDDATSPCVDAGDPTIDPSYERMPNGGRINMGAYGNTAYASMSECWSKSDINCDGIVNFRDFAIFAQDWLQTALVVPGPNVPDVTPPAPAPAIITIGAVSSSSIRMTTSEAFDESGVEYYFEALSAGGHDSGWIGTWTYTDVGLIPDTTYCYRVKARDKSDNYNETIWSSQSCAVTIVLPDTLPPLPDPMQWDDLVDVNGYDGTPREVYFSSTDDYGAAMRAIDADDQAPAGVAPSEVEYYFECIDDPDVWPDGFSSGWRTAAYYPDELERRTYIVKIGPSGHLYRFRVKARDASDNLNETDWSEALPALP